MGKVLPAKDQQEGPLGVMGQLYALVAAVVEYPEYFYRKASNCQCLSLSYLFFFFF